jgi:hypothetical protein
MTNTKLTVEIELSEEESERFGRFIEEGCYDPGKYIRRLILEAISLKQEIAPAASRKRKAN